MVDAILYTTSTCVKCKRVAKFFEEKDITYEKLVIDEDSEARTESIMDNILSVPAIKNKKGKVLRIKDIFLNGSLNVEIILNHLCL